MQGLTSYTAVTIAHEIAHTLGVEHDSLTDFRCNSSHFVMSPRLGKATPNTQAEWSVCSKEQIEKFLQSSRSKCLERQPLTINSKTVKNGSHIISSLPRDELKETPFLLPGITFGPDHQCQILFDRPDAHVCNKDHDNENSFCQQLWLVNFIENIYLNYNI